MLLLQILLICAVPYGLSRLAAWSRVEAVLSPVVLCYALGLGIRNLLPEGVVREDATEIMTQASIALAIPLVLMDADFKAFLRGARTVLLSFATAIFSVFVCCVAGAFIFKGMTDDGAEIAALLAGVYSGGTPNMAAIKTAINADPNLYGALNIADILICGIYLIFLTSVGPRIFRFLLPQTTDGQMEAGTDENTSGTWFKLGTVERLQALVLPISLAVLSVVFSAGISFLIHGGVDASLFIVLITLFGVGISFLPFNWNLAGAYESGDYLLLVFSFALGLMSSFSDILNASMVVIYFTGFVVLGSIILHVLFAKILKIDADTTLITSVACIFGPVFVGQVVAVMKNRKMLVPGMAMGVAGIALGTFLGIFIYRLLLFFM